MGESVLLFYKDHVKKEWKIAFFTTFVAFLLIHIYKFTNTLPNHDSMFNVYVDQDMTKSGRWFLTYACGISSYFDLPWINGLLCAVYLSMTAAIVAKLFDMKNPVVIGLTGIILAACPSTTETLFFEFTADGYLVGLMLGALSAMFSCKAKCWYDYALSGICICLSCAIYQAYVSFAAVLCICYFINWVLENETSEKDYWRWILKHIVLYAVSLVLYYAIWKCILAVAGETAANYQGINNVGKLSALSVLGGAVDSIRNLFFLFLEWNILEHPASLYAVLNLIFLVSFIYIVIVSIIRSKLYKNLHTLGLMVLALVGSVPVISMWSFLSDTVVYRQMMLHSAVVYYIFALILFDRWVKPNVSTLYAVLMTIMVFNFAVMANISYFYMNRSYEKSYYMGSRMMERIEMVQETEEVSEIAFVGNRAQEVSLSPGIPGGRIHILGSQLEEDLLYDHNRSYYYLHNIFGLDLQKLPESRVTEMEMNDEVREMGVWPAQDSVKVVDDVLVIKLEALQ